MNLIGKEINGCYRIIEKIGENILCRIYLMEGVFSPIKAVFKILKQKNDVYNLEELFRFKQKMKGIYNIKHPNINSVYEVEETEDQTYVIMEYIEGITLNEYLQKNKKPDFNEISSLISNIAKGIYIAHRNGVVHNNLNLNNILIPENGNFSNAKITNFGFSDLILTYHSGEDDFIKNILYFLPPEACRILGRDMDEKSDLYSLGILFYFLVTGDYPFVSDSVEGYFRKIMNADYPAPSKISSIEFPEIIDPIIKKLLNPDKKMRYQSAMSLIDDMEKIKLNETDFVLGEDDQKFDSNFEIDLIDRNKEFKSLCRIFNEAEKGKGGICSLGGVTGIGKSRLIEEFSKHVFGNSGIFLEIKPDSQPVKKPYETIIKLFDKYCEYLEKSDRKIFDKFYTSIRESHGANYNAVKRIFFRENAVKNGKADRNGFHKSAADFFFEFIRTDMTLVIAFMDSGMIDRDSVDVLRLINKKIPERNMMLLYSYNSDSLKNSIINGIISDESCMHMKLEALNKEDVKSIINDIFNDPDFKIPHGLTDFIYGHSEGIPYYAIEIIRNLVNKEIIFPVMDKWEIDREKINGIDWKDKREIILDKIQMLKKIEIDILYLAVVLETEFTIEILFELIVNQDKSDIIASLDYLVNQEIIGRNFHARKNFYSINKRIFVHMKGSMNPSLKKMILLNAAKYYENEFKKNGKEDDLISAANLYMKLKMADKAYKYLMKIAAGFIKNYGFGEGRECYKTILKLIANSDIKNKKKEMDRVNEIISNKFA